MTITAKATLEVASDLLGFFSAILLLVPTLRGSAARYLVVKRRTEILERYKSEGREPNPEVLRTLQEGEDVAASLFRREDRALVVWGFRLLVGSFGLKLIYHLVDKVISP